MIIYMLRGLERGLEKNRVFEQFGRVKYFPSLELALTEDFFSGLIFITLKRCPNEA